MHGELYKSNVVFRFDKIIYTRLYEYSHIRLPPDIYQSRTNHYPLVGLPCEQVRQHILWTMDKLFLAPLQHRHQNPRLERGLPNQSHNAENRPAKYKISVKIMRGQNAKHVFIVNCFG